jgi:hypothetical protein
VTRLAPLAFVDLEFRRTHDLGTRDHGWEEAYAAIVVTHSSVLLHSGDRVLLEITPRSTGEYDVARDHERIRERARLRVARDENEGEIARQQAPWITAAVVDGVEGLVAELTTPTPRPLAA